MAPAKEPPPAAMQPSLIHRLRRYAGNSALQSGNAAEHRNRAVVRTVLSVYGLKIITVGVNLISVPLASSYLGLERYGLWLAMSSLIGFMGLSEFGLGNNLTTLLAQARGHEDRHTASRYVSATLWSAIGMAGTLLLLFYCAYPFISWSKFFNVVGRVATSEAPRAALMLGIIAAVSLVSGLCQRIYAGLQQGYLGAIWQGGGAILGLAALLLVSHLHGGLVALVVALGLIPIFVQILGLSWVLRHGDYGKLLGPASMSRSDYSYLLRGSTMMFLVNVQAVFWFSKDNLLIAHIIGLGDVGLYNTAFRIFQSFFGLLASSVGASLWPAYADAFSRNDRVWMHRTLNKSLILGVGGMALFSFAFVLVGKSLLSWYVGAGMAADNLVLIALGFYFTNLAAVNLLGYALAGIGQVEVIAWGGLIGGLLSIPCSIFAMHRWGIVGLIVANICCSSLFQLLPVVLKLQKTLLPSVRSVDSR